jgi:sugar phosphate isomerase/epimerase
MWIALDPCMRRRLSLEARPRKAAELGYASIELSPRAERFRRLTREEMRKRFDRHWGERAKARASPVAPARLT